MVRRRLSGSGKVAALIYEFGELSKFLWWHSWDAQRIGGKYHAEFVDYATVAIGLYAAAAGISRDQILTMQDLAAAAGSHFDENADRDKDYPHLRKENVQNTDRGYELFRSGAIRATHSPTDD